jgi:hypothetical protein
MKPGITRDHLGIHFGEAKRSGSEFVKLTIFSIDGKLYLVQWVGNLVHIESDRLLVW